MPRKRELKPKEPKSPKLYAELPPALDIRKIGRPSKYDPSFCETVLDLGAQGKSKAQMAARIGVSRTTMDKWASEHPEFLDACKRARELELGWWEDVGQDNVAKTGLNATAFIFQVKNRFRDDYRDVTGHELTGRNGAAIEIKDTTDLETARRVAFMLGRAVGKQTTLDNSPAEPAAKEPLTP